jgi:NAD(P) transhydrogenase
VPDRYDLVVIGSGPAGEKAATQAAYFGKRVAIVERRPAPGGIAVSDAGIPTKTLRETAEYLTGFRRRDVYGISLALDARLKIQRMVARRTEVVGLMTEAVRGNIARMGVELVRGEGRLRPGRRVSVRSENGDERDVAADVVLIATGSRPHHPAGIPFDHPAISDSETILRLVELPPSLLVVGAGAVGCEWAAIFTALGAQVTLLEAAGRILPFLDAEASEGLAKIFVGQGMRVELGATLAALETTASGVEARLADGRVLSADHLLFAGGRIGNTEGLGLAEAGVEVDAKGRIRVDATFRTTAPGIYAAGDVIGPPALASVSQEQGRVAACHAFDISFKEVVDPLPPFGVYAMPEAAMVGLTEEQARATGAEIETGRCPFARNTRARIAGSTEGFVKLVFRRSDRALLGVHIVGDVAAELIHLGQAVIHQGLTIDYFIHTTFNVPTYTEAYKYAAYDGLQRLAAATAASGPLRAG